MCSSSDQHWVLHHGHGDNVSTPQVPGSPQSPPANHVSSQCLSLISLVMMYCLQSLDEGLSVSGGSHGNNMGHGCPSFYQFSPTSGLHLYHLCCLPGIPLSLTHTPCFSFHLISLPLRVSSSSLCWWSSPNKSVCVKYFISNDITMM